MSQWKKASWSRRQEEPKNLELDVKKQLPNESEASTARETRAEGSGCTRVGTRAQGRLDGDEGGVHLGGPREVLEISTQSISQRAEDQSSSMYKLPTEVHHPQELLQGVAVGGWQKSSDGGDVLMERSRPRAGD